MALRIILLVIGKMGVSSVPHAAFTLVLLHHNLGQLVHIFPVVFRLGASLKFAVGLDTVLGDELALAARVFVPEF